MSPDRAYGGGREPHRTSPQAAVYVAALPRGRRVFRRRAHRHRHARAQRTDMGTLRSGLPSRRVCRRVRKARSLHRRLRWRGGRYLAIDHRADAEYLQWLLLMPGAQNRGVGSAIVGDLIASANMAGKPERLRILPVNTGAQRLYERLGFVIKGIEGDFVYMERAAD